MRKPCTNSAHVGSQERRGWNCELHRRQTFAGVLLADIIVAAAGVIAALLRASEDNLEQRVSALANTIGKLD
jgi:hypothetical protein